jgi:tRNA modification GTPase
LRSTSSSPILSTSYSNATMTAAPSEVAGTNRRPALPSVNHRDVAEEDTIYALSSGGTAHGVATAVAVVRITGPAVVPVVLNSMIPSQAKIRRILEQPRTAHLCRLVDSHKQALDHALVLFFPGPHSFTGQDVLELHLHGARAVVSDVLEALDALNHHDNSNDEDDDNDTSSASSSSSRSRIRMAEPGEFTQRAFGAGKLDVLQTEALADLLHSDTSRQRRQALRQLDGRLSRIYQEWRNELIGGLAHAEAVIDFGDDEHLADPDNNVDGPYDPITNDGGMSVWGNVITRMQQLQDVMSRQLSDGRRGELVREGVQIAVVGPPNAGKSTLFNVLAQRDAAIVSPHAGTTRDVLEVQLNLRGVKCRLQDTAGVRSTTSDEIERIGIDRAVRAFAGADLVIAMVDSTDLELGVSIIQSIVQNQTAINDNDDDGLTETTALKARNPPMLLVLNKSDLAGKDAASKVPECTSLLAHAGLDRHVQQVFEVSCTTQHGLDAFLAHLTSTVVARVTTGADVNGGGGDASSSSSDSSVLITRARHRQHIAATVACLERFHLMARQGSSVVDLAAEELRLAASELGRVTGAVDVEDVLDKLFSDFCIGK